MSAAPHETNVTDKLVAYVFYFTSKPNINVINWSAESESAVSLVMTSLLLDCEKNVPTPLSSSLLNFFVKLDCY